MTSARQIAANRQNALKSTGPRTPEGKRRVSRNALRHGLLARDLLLEGESAEEFAAFREGVLEQLAPVGAVEAMLAERVVAAAWRLRRALRMERDVVRESLEEERAEADFLPSPEEPDLTADRAAARTLAYTDTYGKLSRYEAHIERGMYRALHEIQRLQAARQGRAVEPPRAVEVSLEVGGLDK